MNEEKVRPPQDEVERILRAAHEKLEQETREEIARLEKLKK